MFISIQNQGVFDLHDFVWKIIIVNLRFWVLEIEKYFEDLKRGVDECYGVAGLARAKGLDPVSEVESPLALTMAEKSVNLVRSVYPKLNVKKVEARILELEVEFGKLDSGVVFGIAREIAEGKFGNFGGVLENIDCGLRVGFAYMTLGVVVTPIEGFTGLGLGLRDEKTEVEKIPQKAEGSATRSSSYRNLANKEEREKYFLSVNFSGPIRSAGTTATVVFLILVDYLRGVFGFGKYDASEDEVERYVLEIKEYHDRVTNLAYFPSEDEVRFLAKGLPMQISGEPTERLEVSGFRDLKRVEVNRIRGGMCLAFAEGLALKAGKGLGRTRKLRDCGMVGDGWDYLEDYLVLHKKRESGSRDVEATYIKDIVAGRPVFGHPGWGGVFRFRYGRSRTSGFSGVSIHPATMGVSGGFLAHGTQLRLEKPTKACIVTGCDSINGPIVRLKCGSVRRLFDYDEARRLYDSGEIEEVLYLGDILMPVGDVVDRNVDLLRPGYVEEWWEAEVADYRRQEIGGGGQDVDISHKSEEFSTSSSSCGSVVGGFDKLVGDNGKVRFKFESFEDKVKISEDFGVALHPSLIFYWTQISGEEFFELIRWLNGAEVRGDKLVLNWESANRERFGVGKRALEKLGVSHDVYMDNVIVGEDMRAFLLNLGRREFYNGEILEFKFDETDVRGVLEIMNDWCEFEVRDKWGTGIGSRMGRPEKAKSRKLSGSPNSLFPVGDQGGRMKVVKEAADKEFVKSRFGSFICEGCGATSIFERCKCGAKMRRQKFCRGCGEVKDKCKFHNDLVSSWSQKVNIKDYFDAAVGCVGCEGSDEMKGVVVLNNELGVVERLEKGILRSRMGLSVNKDGTVRYDAIEISLTHFKPVEISVSVERLRGLGYLKDYFGEDLVSENQILELMPHDVVLPDAGVLGVERGSEFMKRVCGFVDNELELFYSLERFYSLGKRDDFVGQLVVCMAPHNVSGVVGRVVGWSNMQGILASPFMHAAMRRDCDGDECSVMLLMDVLLNFSRKFLPSHRGGSQDAPLVLNARISVGEVDDQILFFDGVGKYPLEFYELANNGVHSSEVRGVVDLIGDKLKRGEDGFFGNGFGFDCADFNSGNCNSVYKSLPTMKAKVAAQMELVSKLRGVDENDVARLILERHFIRDIRGNLRKFCRQEFRCSGCGEKYRRPPLKGECWKCGGKLIFTVSEGSVKKYLEPALELAGQYNVSGYVRENIELIESFVERVFGSERQETL